MFFCSVAFANDALIYYNSNTTSSQYSNLKSELEDAGFTVTGSASSSVSSNAVSGKELVIDISGTSNCGSTCKSVYDTYVSGGGKLLIVGQYGASNRNSSIEALIESKMGVGSMTLVGGCNGCYGSVARGDYASSTASENTLPGPDLLMIASGGTPMASNSSTSNYHSWYKWDYGSNGGSVAVTYGYIQLLSNRTYASNMEDFLLRTLEEEGLYTATPTYTSSISTSQQTSVNTSRSVTHSGNGIYIEQAGNNNILTVDQEGNNNLIAGFPSSTNSISDANITGNNNTTTLRQDGENNVILFNITGDYNTTTVDQGDGGHSDDNRAEFLIGGDYNTVDIKQRHNNGIGNNGHYIAIGISGDNNNVLTNQQNDGDKIGFILITGDDNDIDLIQQGTGSHYAEIAVGSDQTVAITQDGSGNHNASVSMSGYDAALNLLQDSATDQTYSINQTCLNANGCGTTSLTQQ